MNVYNSFGEMRVTAQRELTFFSRFSQIKKSSNFRSNSIFDFLFFLSNWWDFYVKSNWNEKLTKRPNVSYSPYLWRLAAWKYPLLFSFLLRNIFLLSYLLYLLYLFFFFLGRGYLKTKNAQKLTEQRYMLKL